MAVVLRWSTALLLAVLGLTALFLFVVALGIRLAAGDLIGTLASPPHVLGVPLGGVYPFLLPLGLALLIAAAVAISRHD